MVIPKEIKQNVINGLVLNQEGQWCTIESYLVKGPSNQNLSKNNSILIDDMNNIPADAQQESYHNKDTDRLDTAVLKTEIALAKKSGDGFEQEQTTQIDDSPTNQIKAVETDNLDTKHLRTESLKPDAPDTKLMKLSKIDVDEFDEGQPKNELEDTSELDSVFSDIMSELDVFSNIEEPEDEEPNALDNDNFIIQEKEQKKRIDEKSDEKQNLNTEKTVDNHDTESQQNENTSTSKVLSDWDKARSKSGKIVLYISAASAIIAGIVVIVQILM